jgi:DNA-binding transcriptional ArsR family regulator
MNTTSNNLEKRARMISLAGDATRIKILCFMFAQKTACVSEIADAVGMSIQCVSHHLQMLKDNGLFDTERQGNKICYSVSSTDFTKQLKRLVCDVDIV